MAALSKPVEQEVKEANPLDLHLKELLSRPDLPAFSQHIQQILQTSRDENTSVRHITNLVLREYSVSLKMLRTANSPLYNRSGKAILSVSHAASLLGLTAIRDIAAGALLFEHFRNRSRGLRELMMLSLLTANHARGFAERAGYPRIEEAYLCGMFRNLGEVLVGAYFPRDYHRILLERKNPNLNERHACRKVLRFTYEELGRAMVERWALPPSVRECLQDEPLRISRVAGRPDLQSLVAFSHSLTGVVYRAEPTQSRSRLKELRPLAASLGLNPNDLQQVLDSAVEETRETFRSLEMPLDDLRLHKQVEIAMAAPPLPQEAEPGNEKESASSPQADIRARVAAGNFELHDILMLILEAIYRCGPFDRVLFSLVDAGSKTVHGRLGVGEGSEELIERFRFPLSLRGGPIALTLLRRHDLFLFGNEDGRFDRSAFVHTLNSEHFALCPIIVDDIVIGCIFADRATPIPLAQEIQKQVAELRDVAGQAITIQYSNLAAVGAEGETRRNA